MPTTTRKTKSLLTTSEIWAPTNIGEALRMPKNTMRTQPPGLTMMIHDIHGNVTFDAAASTAFVSATVKKLAERAKSTMTCPHNVS